MNPQIYDFKTLIDELKIRAYSRQTIDTYAYINTTFLEFIKKSPKDVTKSDIERYLVTLYDKNMSSATRHLVCSALKFYYKIKPSGLKITTTCQEPPIRGGWNAICGLIHQHNQQNMLGGS